MGMHGASVAMEFAPTNQEVRVVIAAEGEGQASAPATEGLEKKPKCGSQCAC